MRATFDEVNLSLVVTPLGGNLYRLEESILFSEPELDFGDTVEGTLEGSHLQIHRRVSRSPHQRYDFVLTRIDVAHPRLRTLKEEIIEAGGMWEQISGGVFVVHLPRDSCLDVRAELNRFGRDQTRSGWLHS